MADSVLDLARQQSSSARTNAELNNLWSEKQAQKQMDFQYKMFKEANAMNINEAEKNRIWQQMMSDTAHVREVADLQAAGLNPILSANHGASTPTGALASSVSAPTGAKGDTDESVNMSVASMFDAAIGYMKELDALNVSAKMNERIAQLQADTQRQVAQLSADATRYASSQSSGASRYGSDTQRQIALINANNARELKQLDYDLSLRNQDYMASEHPSNVYQLGSSTVAQKIYDTLDALYQGVKAGSSARHSGSSHSSKPNRMINPAGKLITSWFR